MQFATCRKLTRINIKDVSGRADKDASVTDHIRQGDWNDVKGMPNKGLWCLFKHHPLPGRYLYASIGVVATV